MERWEQRLEKRTEAALDSALMARASLTATESSPACLVNPLGPCARVLVRGPVGSRGACRDYCPPCQN